MIAAKRDTDVFVARGRASSPQTDVFFFTTVDDHFVHIRDQTV